jgi:hypothetical protein
MNLGSLGASGVLLLGVRFLRAMALIRIPEG